MTLRRPFAAMLLTAAALLTLAPAPAVAAMRQVEHPFLLWTREEAAALKQRIDTDPQARAQYDRMVSMETGNAKHANRTMLNLFNYAVMGDKAAGAREKAELLKFIGTVPEPLTEEFKREIQKRLDEVGGDWDKIWTRGNASFADRHMRDEQTLNTLRYDVLYHELTDEQRAGVQKALRSYVQFHLDGHKPWHADFRYTKPGWLPNMSWPRTIGTHLMAVALRDEKLIEGMFNSTGGFKWYMDEYISDGRFYCEEFGKFYSNNGTMLMWCDALDRVGLPQYGWDYKGKGGATMKDYIAMQQWLGYPRTAIPGGMDNFRIVTMGDAKGTPHGIAGLGDHSLLMGYLPDGKTGGDRWWSNARMNGPLPKAAAPLWYEIAHRKYPDAGFDYFLAAMRRPGEEAYLPSLYFGLKPIDPARTKPPTVESYLANERGFAFLRAEESPAYWESPAPAVAVQFGFYYPHYAHDCFSLLGFHAMNRPIYVNSYGSKVDHYVLDQIKNGPPTGYLARHPWKDTNRGHAGVTVDNLGPRPVENGNEGLKNHVMRFERTPQVKFVAGRAKGVFPNVAQERAVFLTRAYMFDVFWLADANGSTRRYEWNVTGPGAWQLDDAWKPTSELNGSMLYRPLTGPDAAQPAGYENKTDGNDLTGVRKLEAGANPWTARILQTCAVPLEKSKLGKAFYDQNIGVAISMLPDASVPTTVYTGTPPGADSEMGGASIIVRREAPATTFVALHEPYANTLPELQMSRVAQSATAVAVGVKGGEVNDRVLLVFGDTDAGKAVTLEGNGESYTFTSHGHIRIGKNRVTVVGDVAALKIPVAGSPKLVINGKETPATVSGGTLTYAK